MVHADEITFYRDFLGESVAYAVGAAFELDEVAAVTVDYAPGTLPIGSWHQGRLIGSSECVSPVIAVPDGSLVIEGDFGALLVPSGRLELVYDQGAVHLYAGTASLAQCHGDGWQTPRGESRGLRLRAAQALDRRLGPRSRLSPLAARSASRLAVAGR